MEKKLFNNELWSFFFFSLSFMKLNKWTFEGNSCSYSVSYQCKWNQIQGLREGVWGIPRDRDRTVTPNIARLKFTKIHTPHVHSHPIHNSQDTEATYMPINMSGDIYIYVYIYISPVYMRVCVCVCIMEYYSIIKKNEVMPFAATWMDLDMIILSEVSQTEKDKYHMISLTCEIWSMTQMNLSTKQKQA